MTCGACGKALPEATARRRFCTPACRARYWRDQRAVVVREALESARAPVERALRSLVERVEEAVQEARETLGLREDR